MENVQSETIRCNTNSVSVNFTRLNASNINMIVKYGSIAGSFVGSSNDYTVTGNAKDGKSSLSDFKGTGSRTVNIQSDSASINIEFTEEN